MTKYTNPFYTLNEAISVLKSLGADPYNIGATNAHSWDSAVPTQDETIFWNDHILSVSTSRVYADFSHYNVVEIHLTAKGFDALVSIIDTPVHKKAFGDGTEFDMYFIEPVPLLKIFTLNPCESDSGDQK